MSKKKMLTAANKLGKYQIRSAMKTRNIIGRFAKLGALGLYPLMDTTQDRPYHRPVSLQDK